MSKIHRNELDIPTELIDRKQWIDYLLSHPIWSYVHQENGRTIKIDNMHSLVNITLVYLNPEDNEIDDDDSLNTETMLWLEAGPMYDNSLTDPMPKGGWNMLNRWMPSHDYRLNLSAKTLEEAYLRLAARLKLFYPNDNQGIKSWWCWWNDSERKCSPADDGFCSFCGFKVNKD